MDQALFLLLIVGILLIMTFLVVVFVIPTSTKPKRKKKSRQKEDLKEEDFQKLQKNNKHLNSVIGALRKTIATYESSEKDWAKNLTIEETKVKKLKDKLLQERQWQEKEVDKYNKKVQESQTFRSELKIVQEGLSKEHTKTLRLEGNVRDFKMKLSDMNDQRRNLEIENNQYKKKLNGSEDQVRQLKKDNAALSKQKNDATFVAKSDYLVLDKKLKETEKELKDIKRNYKS